MKKSLRESVVGFVNQLRSSIGETVDLTALSSCLLESALFHEAADGLSRESPHAAETIEVFREVWLQGGICEKRGLAISFFRAPYFPTLLLEAFFFDKIRIPKELRCISSDACPVRLLERTTGFDHPRVVALFDENWISSYGFGNPKKTFYFIDRFIEKTRTITVPLVLRFAGPVSAFGVLKSAAFSDLEAACVSWVVLHEHFHKRGRLPLPEFLKLKSRPSVSAMEELRVDMLSVTWLNERTHAKLRSLICVKELILAERLLSYAFLYDPAKDYDAISSQILLTFLLTEKGLRLQRGTLSVEPGVWSAMERLSKMITGIESNPENSEVELQLKNFSRNHGNFNFDKRTFELHPFFKECRRLGLADEVKKAA